MASYLDLLDIQILCYLGLGFCNYATIWTRSIFEVKYFICCQCLPNISNRLLFQVSITGAWYFGGNACWLSCPILLTGFNDNTCKPSWVNAINVWYARVLDRTINLFLFQVLDESKLQEVDSLWKEFETPEKANKVWVLAPCLERGVFRFEGNTLSMNSSITHYQHKEHVSGVDK